MCWSARASLNTYLFALFGAAIGLANGVDVPLLAFMLVFSHVQLVEYLIWSRGEPTKAGSSVNKALSLAMCGVLAAEPLAAIWMVRAAAARRRWFAAYGAFLFAAAAYFIISAGSTRWRTSIASNGHLAWEWLPSFDRLIVGGSSKAIGVAEVVGVALVTVWCAFLVAPLWGTPWLFWYGAFALGISVACWARGGTIATMWCWISAFGWLWIIALAVTGFKKRGSKGTFCR